MPNLNWDRVRQDLHRVGRIVEREANNVAQQVQHHATPMLREVESEAQRVGEVLVSAGPFIAQQVQHHATPVLRGVESEAQRVGEVLVSAGPFIGDMFTDSDLRARLGELVAKGLLQVFEALAAPSEGNSATRSMLVGSKLADFMISAGGAFPKLAQVLSLQPELVRNAEVRAKLGTVLENCPAASDEAVRREIERSAPQVGAAGLQVGANLNTGSVAQVNLLGDEMVVKIAWDSTRKKMKSDFKMFKKAREVLVALRLPERDAQRVEKMLHMLVASRDPTLAEFDLTEELHMMHRAPSFLGDEWHCKWKFWAECLNQQHQMFDSIQTGQMWIALLAQRGPNVQAPTAFEALSSERVLVMQRVGGQSLAEMMRQLRELHQQQATGAAPAVAEDVGPERQLAMNVMTVVLGSIIPLQGYMLLLHSHTHGAHTDPHPGNFKFDAEARTLWVLDWGGFLKLTNAERLNLCRLVLGVERFISDSNDETRNEVDIRMKDLGFEGTDLCDIAVKLLSSNRVERIQSEDPMASFQGLTVIPTRMVPLVRAIGIIRGYLSEARNHLHSVPQLQNNPELLSLYNLWKPFASLGLAQDDN